MGWPPKSLWCNDLWPPLDIEDFRGIIDVVSGIGYCVARFLQERSSMFISYSDCSGNVLYKNGFSVLKVKESVAQKAIDMTPRGETVLPSSLTKFPAFIENNVVPRYPSVILIKDTCSLNREEIDEIENHCLTSPSDELSEIISIIKLHKGKSEYVSCMGLFAWISPKGRLSSSVKIADDTFAIKSEDPGRDPLNVAIIANEFESMTIPFHTRISKNKLLDRARYPGRTKLPSSSEIDYIVNAQPLYGASSPRLEINCTSFLRIEDMLSYFGCLTKRQTKIDTLIDCLKSWSSKYYAQNLPDDTLVVRIYMGRSISSPINSIPMDTLLSASSYMKILASDVKENPRIISLIVKLSDQQSDDMAQMLYTLTQDGSSFSMFGFPYDKVQSLTA